MVKVKKANKSIDLRPSDVKGMIRSHKNNGKVGKLPTRMTARTAAFLGVVARRAAIQLAIDANTLTQLRGRVTIHGRDIDTALAIGKVGSVMPSNKEVRRSAKGKSAASKGHRKTEAAAVATEGEVEATE
jgi:histone H3/H4